MQTIHLDTAHINFKEAPEKVVIKLEHGHLQDLFYMLFECIDNYEQPDNELELIILEEIRKTLGVKYITNSGKTKIKLSRSHCRTLFLWLNQVNFSHPLYNTLARDLVDQIYRQIV